MAEISATELLQAIREGQAAGFEARDRAEAPRGRRSEEPSSDKLNFEQRAQTVIQLLICGAIVWGGSSLITVRESLATLQATTAITTQQTTKDISDLKVGLEAVKAQGVATATAASNATSAATAATTAATTAAAVAATAVSTAAALAAGQSPATRKKQP